MFGLFRKQDSEVEQRLTKIDHIIQQSFRGVKKDMQNIHEWIKYLNQLTQNQSQQIQHTQTTPAKSEISKQQLNTQISAHPQIQFMQNALTQVQLQMHSQKSFPNERLQEISQKVSVLDTRMTSVESKIGDVWHRLDQIGTQKVSPKATRVHFREKILKKITRHSKEYTRNMILSLIKKYERISAMNLREIIVEEQALCSKSSFYRFLEDVEKTGEVEVFQEGKEKFYAYKLVREV